ncbi:hypothetical protein QYM36_002100 [Artemia franciscana]|uniref:Uncharacterized protein n=1 Tax=Artemia franciscana TaxID=6661 RepID=A0AA88I437_ARTSF|nr:hypothetical protein QYM36_002100 [Artemia franciscana]
MCPSFLQEFSKQLLRVTKTITQNLSLTDDVEFKKDADSSFYLKLLRKEDAVRILNSFTNSAVGIGPILLKVAMNILRIIGNEFGDLLTRNFVKIHFWVAWKKLQLFLYPANHMRMSLSLD